MTKGISRYDTSEFLSTEEDIKLYLQTVAETGDPDLLRVAIGNVAKARGMTQLAKEIGVSRESLYKSLRQDGNPSFRTMWKLIRQLGGMITFPQPGEAETPATTKELPLAEAFA